MISSGINYLSGGILRVTGGGGSGFAGLILVNSSGALTDVSISNHGTGFATDPDEVVIYYSDTNEDMVSPEALPRVDVNSDCTARLVSV